MARWVQTAEDFLRRHPDEAPHWGTCFREHQGYFLMSEGRLEEAREALRLACAASRQAQPEARILSRAMAVLGEVHRRLGNRREAAQTLDAAIREQESHGFPGDQAGFSWTYLAKLQAGSVTATQLLARAKTTQVEFRDRMGEARTLLLEARLTRHVDSTGPLRRRILEVKEQVPALSRCGLLAKVLDRWNEWIGNLAPDETGDLFWGV